MRKALMFKYYVDIPELVNEKSCKTKGLVPNDLAFCVKDNIVVQEQIDGFQAILEIDNNEESETYGNIIPYFNHSVITSQKGNCGFYNFVQELKASLFKDNLDYVLIGIWTGKTRTIKYLPQYRNRWYIVDIFDKKSGKYLRQQKVREFCKFHNLDYANVIHRGLFSIWDFCLSFLDYPSYGSKLKGIVVKNQDKLNTNYIQRPYYLKITNPMYLDERKRKRDKLLKELIEIRCYLSKVVTPPAVKEIFANLRENGIYIDGSCTSDNYCFVVQRIYDEIEASNPELLLLCRNKLKLVLDRLVLEILRSEGLLKE